ncbi:helix-turn-helix domain-containing protein [Arthrobacter castelli]|uniref:helix-turn-helix domain-containing protein n=1 Tax=Arthrobacter castelli TaxID=271431 RepID=UPI0012DED23E|nr:helix-turn-helix domain-containing protein [Arthrobacter castelli]
MAGHFEGIDLLTAVEVAAILRVSKMTVYRKIHSGELPSVHFGRSFRVPVTALEAYFPEGRIPSPAEGRDATRS